MPRPYKLDLSPAARRDLKRLPLSIQKEIVFQHLPEIARDPFSKTKPLGVYMSQDLNIYPPDLRRICVKFCMHIWEQDMT